MEPKGERVGALEDVSKMVCAHLQFTNAQLLKVAEGKSLRGSIVEPPWKQTREIGTIVAGTPDWSGLVSLPIASVFVGRRLAMALLPPALKNDLVVDSPSGQGLTL